MLFKRYLEERPSEMQKSDPFDLTVNKKLASSIWYKKTPVKKDATNTTDHQKHERELSTEGSLSREELDQP